MRVINIYYKKDLDMLTCNLKAVSLIMNNFFNRCPSKYRKNYDRNLETLEIYRVDEHYCMGINGNYIDDHNVLLFKDNSTLIHELFHVASSDLINQKCSIARDKNILLFENGMIEGMTEYLASLALKEKPQTYLFEVFTASMLSSIDGFFEPYFIPDYEKFISLFPNKKDIISLMYSLNYYFDMSGEVLIDESLFDDKIFMDRMKHSIRDVINGLISIELSFNKSDRELRIYSEKFMELINEIDLKYFLGDFWEGYFGYANRQVNKRILRRV